MIITSITGGLGNQMFQYAIAKSMAQKNKSALKLDISFYPKQALRNYELNLFNINEAIATKSECDQLRGHESVLFKIAQKVHFPWKYPATYVKEKEVTIFDEEIYRLNGDMYLDGYWQNEKYFTSIRDELIKEFTPLQGISTAARSYLKNIEDANSVSLHIRRGDYVANSHTNNVHGVCDLEYYKRAIEYIDKKVVNPTFYIFSDDITWCKENFDFLENKCFVSDTETAIDDLMLMKQCKHNIIANSSFSWWSAWLNENSNKIVVAPQIWFNSTSLTLALEKWVKIK